MLFHTPLFLFLFLPLLLFLFFSLQGKWRNWVLLGGSFFFYLWGEPRFFPIAVLSSVIDFHLCNKIFQHKDTTKARSYLIVGIILNVLLLFCFKYLDFFLGSANTLFSVINIPPLPLPQIILPIGVSFLVFEKITYLVDVYKGKGKPAESLKQYLLYIFLFPKLLAGPIVKYHDIAAQLKNHHHTLYNFLSGFKRFLLGIVKKVLIADTLAEVADEIFGLPSSQLGFTQAWLGTLCFTLQIYFDFSAYSDMAIGLARMFGFRLLENFNMPYIAKNFTEFWRRWHISLSTWIKEYLYVPLGGNQNGVLRTYFNLWLCFLLSGLWHGASWNFILWGAYNGIFLVLDKLFWVRFSTQLPPLLNVIITFILVMLGWVIFRATSIEHIGGYFSALLNPWQEGAFIFITANEWTAIIVALFLCFVPLLPQFEKALDNWRAFSAARMIENWLLALLTLFAFTKAMSIGFNPFLYFRF